MPNVCTHGNLKRQCELCQRDDEIAELQDALKSATDIREAEKRILLAEIEKNAALAAECARLREALEWYRDCTWHGFEIECCTVGVLGMRINIESEDGGRVARAALAAQPSDTALDEQMNKEKL